MKKKILILGYGYVGGYLYNRLKQDKNNDVTIVKREFLDYTDSTKVEQWLKKEKDHYNYVINCSGFTGRPNVDEGEKNLSYVTSLIPLHRFELVISAKLMV